MYNYHNIIPIILIHVLIIILFEGIIFYLYLFKMEEKLITDKLIKITNELKNNINIKTNQLMEKLNPETINISPEIPSNANTLINNKKEKLLNAMKKDEEVNFNNNKYGMKIFIGLIVSIILLLLIYIYLVYYVFKAHIDWFSVIIVVIVTIGLIVVMEYLYITKVLFNKKFNESHIQLAFIHGLLE